MNKPPQLLGLSITIRPIRIRDEDKDADFVLLPQSKHFQFLGSVRNLSPKKLRAFSNADGRYSMAFVATVNENGMETEVGVSRYAQNPNRDIRELAVSVTDKWQKRGLDVLLAEKLIEFAKDHGVKTIYSIDLADNASMRHLAGDLGMAEKRNPEDNRQVIYSLTL